MKKNRCSEISCYSPLKDKYCLGTWLPRIRNCRDASKVKFFNAHLTNFKPFNCNFLRTFIVTYFTPPPKVFVNAFVKSKVECKDDESLQMCAQKWTTKEVRQIGHTEWHFRRTFASPSLPRQNQRGKELEHLTVFTK